MEEGVLDLMEIFHKIVKPGVRHCQICYRTESETKLVNPIYLLEFRRNLGSSLASTAVCYMCEAAAKAAVKFRNANILAQSINNIMGKLRALSRDEMTSYEKWMLDHLPEKASKLAAYRNTTILRQTEVLVVDSNCMDLGVVHEVRSRTGNSQSVPQTMPTEIETVVLDDDDDEVPDLIQRKSPMQAKIQNSKNQNNKKQTAKQKSTPTPRNSTNIPKTPLMQTPNTELKVEKLPTLVDLKYLLEQPHDKRKELAAIVPDKMQLISGHATLVDNFLLHPLVSQNGILTVPSLGAEIVNDKLVYNAKRFVALPIVNYTNNPTQHKEIIDVIKTNLPQNPQIAVQHKTVQTHSNINNTTNNVQTRGRQFLNAHTFNKDCEKGNTNDNSSNDAESEFDANVDCILKNALSAKKRRREEMVNAPGTVLDLDTITSILAERSDGPLGVIADVRSERETEEPIKISNVISHASPKSSSRIDWEDKIPMDVISFIDATDPNAENEMIVPDKLPRITEYYGQN